MDDRQQAHHRRHNLATREAWNWFESHRERVTAHLITHAAPSLAVWGAGNCNDLDLAHLLRHFEQITLFDLDRESLAAGVARQGFAEDHHIRLTQADVVEMATGSAAGSAAGDSPESFHVVASVGLLSQILHFAQTELATNPALSWPHLERLRLNHVWFLLQTTLPGGNTLLFNDFLSSVSCPELLNCSASELPALLQRELQRQNFFTGMNPHAIAHMLGHAPELARYVAHQHTTDPWMWQLGPQKSYAVCLHQINRI